MKLIMKFGGVSPQQLVRLHDALNGPDVIGSTPIGEYMLSGEREWVQVEKPRHAEILSSKLDPKTDTYSVEIGVNVQMPTVSGYKSALAGAHRWQRADRDVLVSRKVIDSIFSALTIFPQGIDEEILVTRSPNTFLNDPNYLKRVKEEFRKSNIKNLNPE